MIYEEAAKSFHRGPVSCVDMRADGLLASGGYDAEIALWEPSGRALGRLRGHRALVNGVRFSPDGAYLASASSDHDARVWDVATGACTALLRGHDDDVNAVAWSPDGRCVATASFDGSGRVFDAASGALLCLLRGHESDVNGVDWSSRGDCIATASDDGSVRLFSADGTLRGVLRGHGDWVDQVAFSPDATLVASASLDCSVRVWDVATLACVAVLGEHGCTVKAVRWSPDGDQLATAAYDKRIRVFERGSWQLVHELFDARMWNRSLAWGSSRTLATGSFAGTPVRWRIGEREGRTLDRLGAPSINGMALSPSGELAALASDDGGARIVEVASGRILRERFDHRAPLLSAAWSGDGRRIAFGGWDDRVSLYSLPEPAPVAWIAGHGQPVNAVAFSLDGAQLGLGSFLGIVSAWNAETGALVGELGRHAGSVKSLAALPGGGWLSGGRDGRLRLHGPGVGGSLEVGHTIVNGVAVSPDGRRAACASRGCGVEWFDLASGRRLASFREHPCSARAVAVSPDGECVAAAYYDGQLLLWTPRSGARRLTQPFGAKPLSSLAFAPDGRELVVATWDAAGHFGRVDAMTGALRSERSVLGGWQ